VSDGRLFLFRAFLTAVFLAAMGTCLPVGSAAGTTERGRLPARKPPPRANQARPHPAVCRVIATERIGVSFGSGTLIDVRGRVGLVVTNWHVIRDAAGPLEVVFPDGFRSPARPLKTDKDWDLAALVVWRPQSDPVPLADRAPQPGDWLMIAGYGRGRYRAASGRCTQYVAPGARFPLEMVELSAEARQGDSGGPIFNAEGELAGVLFGAGQGVTMGSYGGRVRQFLASLTGDPGYHQPPGDELPSPPTTPSVRIAQVQPAAIAASPSEPAVTPSPVADEIRAASQEPKVVQAESSQVAEPAPDAAGCLRVAAASEPRTALRLAAGRSEMPLETQPAADPDPTAASGTPLMSLSWQDVSGDPLLAELKSILAIFGAASLLLLVTRAAAG